MKNGKSAWRVLGGLFLAALVAAGGCRSSASTSAASTCEKGQTLFTMDFAEKDLKGQTFSTAAQRGQVVLVNIFATWCPPCQSETPSLIEMYNKYHDQGLRVVMVSTETSDQVEQFAQKYATPFPMLADAAGQKVIKQVPDFRGYPTTLLLDKEGHVRYQIVGLQKATLTKGLEKLLAE
jgi:peroxiredoxin